MKKFTYLAFALVLSVFTSCTDKEEIEIIRHHTLTYIINTQRMYDDLGITSEITSNYLNKNFNVAVYTFIYDSNQNLVTNQSSKESSLGTVTESFQIEEGAYTIVTYETLVGNVYTPSWSGQEKLSTLTFNDNSSSDYHYTLGTVKTEVVIIGGDKTESVSPAATRHLLTLNIGTQNMYDTFGRSNYERLLSNDYNYYVGVTSLVYDNSGQFVDSINTYIKTFQSIQQKFSLSEGSYTIVTVETLVNGDNKYTSDIWKTDNIQNLSDVVLLNSTKYSEILWSDAVGTSSCTVSIGNSNQSQTLTPSAIGSLVNVIAANFDKSDYSQVAFYTKNLPNGIMLSPNVTEKYYYTNYLQSDYWIGRGFLGLGFISKDDTYRFKEIESTTVYIVESGSISWLLGCSKASYLNDDGSIKLDDYPRYGSQFTFQNGQIYYAYIRYRGDEKGCDANLGTNNEISTWVDNLEPIVNPDALYAEPYTTWGGTVASVKSFMSGYIVGNNGNLIERDGNYILCYYGKYKEFEIDYWFTSSTGGLTDAVLFFDAEVVGEDELSKAFTEMGYEFIVSGEDYSAYITKDKNSYVMVRLNSQNFWVVNYFSTVSNSSSRKIMRKEFPAFTPKRKNVMSSKNYDKASIVKELRQCEESMKFYFK